MRQLREMRRTAEVRGITHDEDGGRGKDEKRKRERQVAENKGSQAYVDHCNN